MASLTLIGDDGAPRDRGAPPGAGHLAPVGAVEVPHERAGERRAFVAATAVSLAFVAITKKNALKETIRAYSNNKYIFLLHKKIKAKACLNNYFNFTPAHRLKAWPELN